MSPSYSPTACRHKGPLLQCQGLQQHKGQLTHKCSLARSLAHSFVRSHSALPDGEFLSFDSILKSFFSSLMKNRLSLQSGQHPSTVFTLSPSPSLVRGLSHKHASLPRSLSPVEATLGSARSVALDVELLIYLLPVVVVAVVMAVQAGSVKQKKKQRGGKKNQKVVWG